MPKDELRDALRRLLIDLLAPQDQTRAEEEAQRPPSRQMLFRQETPSSAADRPAGDIARTLAAEGYPAGSNSNEGPRDLPAWLHGAPQPERPRAEQVSVLPNARVKMEAGMLLLGVQKDNSVHIFNPKCGEFEIYCRFEGSPMLLWRAIPARTSTKIYVTMSGTRWPGHPTEVAFGQGGAIFLVDHKEEYLKLVPGSDRFLDPGELLVRDDGLIVVDFMGFGGTGTIYKVDPATGDRSILHEGDPLKEPVGVAEMPNGDLVIANAFMRYAPVVGPGGQKLKEMGALLRLAMSTRQLDVILDESDVPRGVIDSVVVDDEDARFMMYSRNDWPMQETGGVFVVNTATGERATVLEASDGFSVFSRIGNALAGVAPIADSYNKRLYAVDIKGAKVVQEWSLEPILGPGKGMVTPLETVESIRWLP